MIIKRTFRFEKLIDWDHEINASIKYFHEKFNIWPNILMANDYTFHRIDLLANRKQENIRNDNKETPDMPYVILGSFASENYTLDFFINRQILDNSFVLIFDGDPSGDGELIPEEDTELPKERIHAQGNHGHADKITGSALYPINHLDMTPPTSTGSFKNMKELAILISLDMEEELSQLLKYVTDKFKLFHEIFPNTIALNTKWALKVRPALKKANLILEIMCENEMSDDENEFALVRLNPDPGGDGEEVEVQSFLDQIKRVA